METQIFNFEKLFDISPDLICIAGYDGYLKKVNPSVSKTLGYTFEELYKNPINSFVHPSDVIKTSSIREKLINKSSIVNFENRYITKQGKIIWLSWTAKADDANEVVFAIAKNITKKKKEETDKINHIENLSSRNTNYQNLSYTTSHDLRAPIDNILALLEFINVNELNEENEKMINLIETSTKNLKNKLNHFIDSLGNFENIKINLKKVDFDQCLNEAIYPIKNLIQNSNLHISSDFSAVRCVVFNKSYLESIFLNLISNAIKYARPKVHPKVFIYTNVENNQIKLYVKDNGLGFNLEKSKNKVFKLHQTFHEHSESKGIGLYLVNFHVTSLGGSITLDSEENKGTTFTITFDRNLEL